MNNLSLHPPKMDAPVNGTVLVVDDTPTHLRLLVEMLGATGYSVRPTRTGASALTAVRQNPPDLILLDIMMPGMSGYEVCAQLKADERTRDIPIIFISALDEELDKLKAFSLGAVDYITKPFQMGEVMARVKTHLALRQAQKSLAEKNVRLQQEIAERQAAEQKIQQQNKFLHDVIEALANPFKEGMTDPKRAEQALQEAYVELEAELNRYSHEGGQILQLFANQAAVAIRNAQLFDAVQKANDRMQDELSLAREIQYSLLPSPRPHWPQLDVICYTIPAQAVGGDFYRYHAFNGSKFAFAVGDVSGKGVSAALLMAASLAQFDASLTQDFTPEQRLAYLDRAISPYTKPRRQNCAMCYVEIELASTTTGAEAGETGVGQLHMVNAGCIPPYIKRAHGGVETHHELGGFALGHGLATAMEYRRITLNLSKGDLVILISDGVVEAVNPAGAMLGFAQLEAILRVGPTTSAKAMLAHLRHALFTFMGQAEQQDDLTMVVVQV